MSFPSIRIEGSILSGELLARLDSADFPGQRHGDFGFDSAVRLKDDILRAWTHAQNAWRMHGDRLDAPRASKSGITETRNFIEGLFGLLGYAELEYNAQAEIVGDKPFRFTHRLRSHSGFPVHIVGARESLDRKPEGSGPRVSPHAHVQEYLNLTEHLYALVTNGRLLRLLRDSTRLVKLSYVEFDLDRIFGEELFADFAVLYRLLHVSRLPKSPDAAAESLLERYHQDALESGARIRDGLRVAVEQAIRELGSGFLARTPALAEAIAGATLSPQQLYHGLLRLIYRLLFLMAAEERGLLFPSGADQRKRRTYEQHYSLARLRRLAERRQMVEPGKDDLWLGLRSTFRLFEEDNAGAPLGVTALCGDLFSPEALGPLRHAQLDNATLLSAIARLSVFRQPGTGQLTRVNYGALATEEFGSVYESLLELHPIFLDGTPPRFAFKEAAGNERKTSGSYYTPSSLVECLLDSALEPVLAERLAGKSGVEAEKAILSLKVCDPAVGSGHFLIAAAQRLARRLATIRAGDDEPSPEQLRHALREVIGHCLYGVDVNRMSAELCRVGLWLEALEPGKSLAFLQHHIRDGNSLIGVTPALLSAGLPDEAFEEIEGDDSIPIDGRRRLSAAAELRKLNKRERGGYGGLFATEDAAIQQALQTAAAAIDALPDDRPEQLRQKADAFARAENDPAFQRNRHLADTWCAAFVARKTFRPGTTEPRGITQRNLNDLAQGHPLPADLADEVGRLRATYGFFHWHLVFPEVFAQGGFDVILGNPPWDTLSPDQREFFGKFVTGLRSMAPEQQQAEIATLLTHPSIAAAWISHCRELFGLVHFLKNSGVFTLYAPGNLGKGDFNIYRMFVETALRRVRVGGYAAMVVPGGLYGGANASAIREHMLNECQLRRIYGLINTRRGWFAEVDIDRFAAFAVQRGGRTQTITVQFGLTGPEDLTRTPVEIAADIIRRLSPETFAIPDVRDLGQLAMSRKMYAACPAHGDADAGPPVRRYSAELHMGNNRDLFTTDPAGLPVYEGRMIDHFDHRVKTYESGHGNSAVWIEREFGDPAKAIVPQWRVLREKLPSKLGDRCDRFRIGFGDVANPRNERSFTASLIPPGVVCGDKVPTLDFGPNYEWFFLPWLAVANTFAMDWLARTRLTSPKMAFSLLDGLPFPRPAMTDELVQTVAPVVLRLICTAPEMTPYWNQMAALGFVEAVPEGTVPPSAFTDPALRAEVRADLDAYVAARVFSLTAQELADVLDTFEVLRRRDEKAHGSFRTKELILASHAAGADITRWRGAAATPAIRVLPARPAALPPPTLREVVAAFTFAIPALRRPQIQTTAELFTVLLPALVQEAGGTLAYADFLSALAFLAEPPRDNSSLPPQAASAFTKWRGTFPATLADPNALRAALHDLIVMRHALNIRRESDGFTLFPGIQWAAITHEWTLLDARLALSHAAAVATATPPWRGAVPDADLHAWTTAA